MRTKADESCSWRIQSDTNYFVGVISSMSGRQIFEHATTQFRDIEHLSGIGDRAFVANESAYSLKGDRLVIVQVVTTQPTPARKQAALTLIQAAMSRA